MAGQNSSLGDLYVRLMGTLAIFSVPFIKFYYIIWGTANVGCKCNNHSLTIIFHLYRNPINSILRQLSPILNVHLVCSIIRD